MMENKSIIITLVLVFIVGLLLGNILIGGFTGQVSRDVVTQIYVEPAELLTDEDLTVTIIPGSKGATNAVFPYRENEYGQTSRVGEGFAYCRRGRTRDTGATCKVPVTFKYGTSLHWKPGTYFLRVYDVGTKSYVRAYFAITGHQEFKGT